MRRRSSCRTCRQRHKRCVTRAGATQCFECEQLGRHCQYEPRLQFRFSHRTAPRRPHAKRPRNSIDNQVDAPQFISADPDQTPNEPLRGEASPFSSSTFPVQGISPLGEVAQSGNDSTAEQFPAVNASSLSSPTEPQDSLSRSPPLLRSPQNPSYGATLPSAQSRSKDPSRGIPNSTSPHSTAACSYDPTDSEGSCPPRLNFSAREAYLMRLYILDVSLSPDSCDEERHFATAIPQLALEEPMILYGIFALGSRFDEIKGKRKDDMESTHYHNKCIELLIKALSEPPETYGVSLLTTVVLSRLYEEFDVGKDTQFYHLGGTQNLLCFNAITQSAQNGGLAEAVCWLHLHQVIYISMVHKQQPRLHLEIFETFKTFRGDGNRSHANRSVYLLAKALNAFFASDRGGDGSRNDQLNVSQAIEDLDQELDDWYKRIPRSFCSLHEEPADIEAGKPFPIIWMLSSLQVMALEYYYASKIIICLYRSSSVPQAFDFNAVKARKANEESILYYIRRSLGLARGNDYFPGAYYMPSYVLFLCGYLVRNPIERTHCIQFLVNMQERVPRESSGIIQSLQRQWNELDSLIQ